MLFCIKIIKGSFSFFLVFCVELFFLVGSGKQKKHVCIVVYFPLERCGAATTLWLSLFPVFTPQRLFGVIATAGGEDVLGGTVLDGRLCTLLAYCICTIWVNPWRCAAVRVQKFSQQLRSLEMLDDTVFNQFFFLFFSCLFCSSLYTLKDFICGLSDAAQREISQKCFDVMKLNFIRK